MTVITRLPATPSTRSPRHLQLDAIFEEESARRGLVEQTAATLVQGGYLPEDASMFCPGNPAMASALEAAMARVTGVSMAEEEPPPAQPGVCGSPVTGQGPGYL